MKHTTNLMIVIGIVLSLVLGACTLPPPPMAQPMADVTVVGDSAEAQIMEELFAMIPGGTPSFVLPGMGRVQVKEVPYRTIEGNTYRMVIYYPADMSEAMPYPAVIFPFVWPDEVITKMAGAPLPELAQYKYWGRLLAADGMVAVTYYTGHNDDFAVLMGYLVEHANELQIDMQRIGFWACSSHTYLAHSYIHQPGRENIRFLVHYYGAVMAPDQQFRDVFEEFHANAGAFYEFPQIESYRTDLPILLVRAGLDGRPMPNDMIDHFLDLANDANLQLTYINYADGQHGFDMVQSSLPRTGEIIEETLAFIHASLATD